MEQRALGQRHVAPIGFGAMRLTGPNVFGPPRDRDEAVAVLHEAVRRGVDHIDTAQFYGPDVVNELIREALHPYPEQLVLVSKVGAPRDRRGAERLAVTPAQLVLAWTLAIAPTVLLTPGTSSLDHPRENLASSSVDLDTHAMLRLDSV